MKKLTLISVLTVLCLQMNAQQRPDIHKVAGDQPVVPLKIGDPIPEALWNLPLQVANHPEGKECTTLSEFRDKLIILDFWATWCAPCVRKLPELPLLLKEFDGQLQIVLSTSEERDKIFDFLMKRQLQLTSIIEDKTLKLAFPKNSIPHEVWIKNGEVFAITDDYHVNAETIRKVLNGDLSTLTEKKWNRNYNLREPLLIDGNGGASKDLLYHSIITGYLDGIGGGGVFEDSLGRFKLRILNGTAFELYTFAAGRVDYSFYLKNRIKNTTAVKELLTNLNSSDQEHRKDFFSYELIVPKDLAGQTPYIMIDELNRFFGAVYGIRGELKQSRTKCWVLRRKADVAFTGGMNSGSPVLKDKDNGDFKVKSRPFAIYFLTISQIHENQPYPFIDKTGINEDVVMKIVPNTASIKETRQLLETYGLTLALEDCEVALLVFSDIKN